MGTTPVAEATLRKDDDARHNWSRHLYDINPADPTLYDLVVHVRKLTVTDAANVICDCVGLPQFEATVDSQQAIEDLALAAEVKAVLFELAPQIEVVASGGVVTVKAAVPMMQMDALSRQIEAQGLAVGGVAKIRFEAEFVPPID